MFTCVKTTSTVVAQETKSLFKIHPFPGASRAFSRAGLEATQEQNDSFFSQLPYKCYIEEVASVGDLRFLQGGKRFTGSG